MKQVRFPVFYVVVASVTLSAASAIAQIDTVEKVGGGRPIRGRIVEISSTAIVVNVSGSNQTVQAGDVRRVSFSGANGTMKQAFTQFYSGNYNGCLDSIDRITDAPKNKHVVAELAYCKAMSMAHEAMAGGNVTINNAGTQLLGFINENDEYFHFFPATQMYAKLCLAINKFDLAKQKLKTILDSNWAEQILLARIELGKIALIEEKFSEAVSHFTQAEKVNASDDTAAQLKLVAKCRLAQATAMTGDAAASIKTIKAIIQKESNDNKLLFSNAYNALAHCHLKTGDKKSALMAFLHTHLLFTGHPDTHAEALFHLTKLWNDLSYPERAAEAQSNLRSSYRNTYYGSKS